MLFLGVVFLIVALTFLPTHKEYGLTPEWCPQSASLCPYFHHTALIGSVFVAFCYFIAFIALSRLSKAKTTEENESIRGISDAAVRFFVDVAVGMTIAILYLLGRSIFLHGALMLPFNERVEFIVGIPLVTLTLVIEFLLDRRNFGKLLGNGTHILIVLVLVAVVLLGRNWADWSWSGIAIFAGVVAGVTGLANWLTPEKKNRKAFKAEE
jgi:uncharacterized membrane protein